MAVRKSLSVVLVLLEVSYLANCSPQLNLPPTPESPSVRPEVVYNGYSPNQFPDRSPSDRDRSQRNGPPYGNEEEDQVNDFRQGVSNPNFEGYNNYQGPPTTNLGGNTNFQDLRNTNFGGYNNNQDPRNSTFSTDPYNPRQFDRNNFQLDQDRRYSFELEKARRFLVDADYKGSLECTANVGAQWNFETDVNEITQAEALHAQQRYADFQHLLFTQIKDIDRSVFFDENIQRQLRLLGTVGPSALPADQLDRYNRVINDMLAIYNGASICEYQQPFQCGLTLQPDLKVIMATSRDWDELQHVWTEWRRKTGKPIRDLYEQLIDLMNDVAFANNYRNAGEYWYEPFENQNFRQDIEAVWSEIQPLYELLHAYVRRKLREYYGPDRINRNAPLPAHVLGNMYAQSWTNILDITIPYPGKTFLDVTPRMLQQGYTPMIMFQLAEEFFHSINMSDVDIDFWRNSIVEQPPDRVVTCSPSAWDFCNRHDFRIKMCTRINHADLVRVHHEMAHVHYFLSYRHQPKVYRDGAMPGLHEAVGDAIGLSISTPKHLQTLGLVQKSVDDISYDINFLFAMAMDKVAFLPFALAIENWRYDVFARRINREMINCHYWDLREQYGGIKPPVLRSEMDFDPGAKYHIPANIPYMKYFVGTVLQFQIYRAMCRASRQYDPSDPQKPLHKCDIYRQPEAGNVLRKLMEKGASQRWQLVLAEAIGEDRLDGSALREYFRPLEDWLRNENLRNQEFVGWSYDGDYCKRSIETSNLQVYGGFYNDGPISGVNWKLWSSLIILRFSCQFIF